MKYTGMPAGMWMLFNRQFKKALIKDLGYDSSDAKRITKVAKPKYRKIIEKFPEFEKGAVVLERKYHGSIFLHVFLIIQAPFFHGFNDRSHRFTQFTERVFNSWGNLRVNGSYDYAVRFH